MKIISINAGSSSLKFQLYLMPEEKVLISGLFDRIGLDASSYTLKLNDQKIKVEIELKNHDDAVDILLNKLIELNVITKYEDIHAVGHRVVHGGSVYSESVLLNEENISEIEKLSDLAPLHNPANLSAIKTFIKKIPSSLNVAVFDTAFHQTMPEESYLYGVPYEWYKKYNFRRYGFHGTSHRYIASRLSYMLNKEKVNAITCHLGNGASICAIKEGKSYDTSMGFTPNSGLIMGTRSGDFDFTGIPYLMTKMNCTFEEVLESLNKKSGFLGVSEISSDSRNIEDGIANNDERSIRTQKIYVKRIVEYIAKYYVLLGGVDAISFSGGVGEKSIQTRKEIIEKLSVLNIFIDDDKNNVRDDERVISSDDSSVKVFIVPTDEELMIARDTYEIVG
jgi:acetate kinase